MDHTDVTAGYISHAVLIPTIGSHREDRPQKFMLLQLIRAIDVANPYHGVEETDGGGNQDQFKRLREKVAAPSLAPFPLPTIFFHESQ